MSTIVETSRPRRIGAIAAAAIAALAGGAVALLWAWNTLAVELFAAPTVGFRHAVAIELVAVVVGALIALAFRIGGSRGAAH